MTVAGSVASPAARPEHEPIALGAPASWTETHGVAVPPKTSPERRARAGTIARAALRDRHPHRRCAFQAWFSWRLGPALACARKMAGVQRPQGELHAKTQKP